MHNYLTRYREDTFFRSTVNVVALQALLVTLIIIVFAVAAIHQQRETASIIQERRVEYAAGARYAPGELEQRLQNAALRSQAAGFVALLTLAILFGIIVTRYALAPTRQSLDFQRRFIGNVAHEIRTPLSIIRTNAEVSLMDPKISTDARETLTLTIQELDRISGIINNLLSFDALMRPGQIRFEPLLLHGIALDVVTRHATMAKQYGIAIGVDVAEELVYVMGNRIALEQAITNLVKNALNYTPQHDGQSVVVRIDDKGENVALSVIDSGIGIAQKDLYYVFQPFFRGDTSRARHIGTGTSGLGLAIVNEIVRAHSGHIVIRSALNRGTTIELSFPKADTREHVKHIAPEEDDLLHEEVVG